jgi:hypothetical protein
MKFAEGSEPGVVVAPAPHRSLTQGQALVSLPVHLFPVLVHPVPLFLLSTSLLPASLLRVSPVLVLLRLKPLLLATLAVLATLLVIAPLLVAHAPLLTEA